MHSHHTTPRIKQYLTVATATTIVAGLPVAAVWWLRVTGRVTTTPMAVGMGMGISLWLSSAGRLIWETRPGSEDLLFSELMIWGYLHRLRSQRRLANVTELFAPIGSGAATAQARPSGQARNVKLLEQLVSGMETRDPYLHGHSRRVARHSWMIARRMGLPRDEVARIRTAAAIHDVGKINTPKAILHKPGRLTDAEYEVIKRHPGEGAEMAAVLADPAITAIVRHHHERADGSGYPNGLKGEEIPLGARIVAVADTFDAITSARPYRAASAHNKAIDILRDEAGTRLDPDVVKAFCIHYAGRRPLALWSFVAGLPERAVTWLGSSAASVASVAKVAAVAALVSGTTAVTVAARPVKPHHRAPEAVAFSGPVSVGGGGSTGRLAVAPAGAAGATAAPARKAPKGWRHGGSHATPVPKPTVTGAAPATVVPATEAAAVPTPGSTTQVATPEKPAGETPAQNEEPSGKGVEPSPKPKSPAELKKEAEQKKKEEAERKKKEAEEAARKKKEEAARRKKEEAELAKKIAAERKAAEEKAEAEEAAGEAVTTTPDASFGHLSGPPAAK